MVLFGADFDVSKFHHLRVLADGKYIHAFVDHGALAYTSMFDGRYTSGWSGLRVDRAVGLFDNLEISKIGPEDPLP